MSASGVPQTVEVDLDALCVIIETAVDRAGLYMDRPLYPAYMAMPETVRDRLADRQKERTERHMASLTATSLHSKGERHDEAICFTCVSNAVAQSRLEARS